MIFEFISLSLIDEGIVQDDFEDWFETAGAMARIYAEAYVVIGASASTDCTGGLHTKWERPSKEIIPGSRVFVQVLWAPPLFKLRDGTSFTALPLFTRGWIYQERVMAQRFVHFVANRIVWECPTRQTFPDRASSSKKVHSYPGYAYRYLNGQFDEYIIKGVEHGTPLGWHATFEAYSSLQLTFDKDRLPAVSALVRRELSTRRKNDEYVAGMWKATILEDLGWYTLYRHATRPEGSKIPSWSWASIRQAITFTDHDNVLPRVKILDLSYERIGPAHLGNVAKAALRIQAPTFTTYGITSIGSCGSGTSGERLVDDLDPSNEHRFDILSAVVAPEALTDSSTTLLVALLYWHGITAHCGLILRPLNMTEYERIGFVMIYEVSGDFIRALPISTILIV